MNSESTIIFSGLFLGAAALVLALRRKFSIAQSLLIVVLRLVWIAPVIFCFFPKVLTKSSQDLEKPQDLKVFIDDSKSIRSSSEKWGFVQNLKESLLAICLVENCKPSFEFLGQLDARTSQNLTPLSAVLPAWIADHGSHKKIIVTDGADFLPEEWDWVQKIQTDKQRPDSSFLVGNLRESFFNVWVERFTVPVIAFEQKPMHVYFELQRSGDLTRELATQIQISNNNKVVLSQAVVFAKGSAKASGDIILPGATRGSKIISAYVLPSEGEKNIADNIVRQVVDVQRNTIGVLHILGSPSWDGRFLRRFLKAEPKFDLISFFILRDPWDVDIGSERDLSLIPFPTEKLFGEELKNFNLIIIQNFSMFQFLTADHQKNLIEFVRRGGGLVFIGGPRALTEIDLQSSPLREIFPFEFKPKSNGSMTNPLTNLADLVGNPSAASSSYVSASKFSFESASLEKNLPVTMTLADELLPLSNQISSFANFDGYNEFAPQKSHGIESQILFNGVRSNGSKFPLIVNSFPGKGRATWILTDQLWKLTQNLNSENKFFDQNVYNEFFSAIVRWTLRNETVAALQLQHLEFLPDNQKLSWSVILKGALINHLQPEDLSLRLCELDLPKGSFAMRTLNSTEAELKGKIPWPQNTQQQICAFQLRHNSEQNGDWDLTLQKNLPKIYSDDQIGDNPKFFRLLKSRLGARYANSSSNVSQALKTWIHGADLESDSTEGATVTKTVSDYYWFLRTPYFFLFLLGLPMEILVRKYRDLF